MAVAKMLHGNKKNDSCAISVLNITYYVFTSCLRSNWMKHRSLSALHLAAAAADHVTLDYSQRKFFSGSSSLLLSKV